MSRGAKPRLDGRAWAGAGAVRRRARARKRDRRSPLRVGRPGPPAASTRWASNVPWLRLWCLPPLGGPQLIAALARQLPGLRRRDGAHQRFGDETEHTSVSPLLWWQALGGVAGQEPKGLGARAEKARWSPMGSVCNDEIKCQDSSRPRAAGAGRRRGAGLGLEVACQTDTAPPAALRPPLRPR